MLQGESQIYPFAGDPLLTLCVFDCCRRLLVSYVKCQAELDEETSLFVRVKPLYTALTSVFGTGMPVQAKETALATLSLLGEAVEDEHFLRYISSQLVFQLGEPDPWLKAQAHCTVS